jgi:hypothetical protein
MYFVCIGLMFVVFVRLFAFRFAHMRFCSMHLLSDLFCLSVYLSVCLSVCLSVRPSVWVQVLLRLLQAVHADHYHKLKTLNALITPQNI